MSQANQAEDLISELKERIRDMSDSDLLYGWIDPKPGQAIEVLDKLIDEIRLEKPAFEPKYLVLKMKKIVSLDKLISNLEAYRDSLRDKHSVKDTRFFIYWEGIAKILLESEGEK